MEVFADALTTFGRLAAGDKCAAPVVLHHLTGGGMFIVKTEDTEAAYEILEIEDIRRSLDTALFAVADFHVDV